MNERSSTWWSMPRPASKLVDRPVRPRRVTSSIGIEGRISVTRVPGSTELTGAVTPGIALELWKTERALLELTLADPYSEVRGLLLLRQEIEAPSLSSKS